MPESNRKHRITIHVYGGLVQNVYTTLEDEVEVVVLDLDNDGIAEEELTELKNELLRVIDEHREIY